MKKNSYYKLLGVCVLGLLSLLAFKNPPQENQLFQNLLAKLLIYEKKEGPEKVYVHTDKDFYTNGETIWFKTYLVNGITHKPSDKSKVVYVELLDGKDSIISNRKLFVDGFGASGDIKIDKNAINGNYTLRAYTKYMLNEKQQFLFQKTFPIYTQNIRAGSSEYDTAFFGADNDFNTAQKPTNADAVEPSVQFFPEGGDLVDGISSTIGLEITDQNGNGLGLKGIVEDGEGNWVTNFESGDFGLGSFYFTPKPGKKYFASIQFKDGERKFPLPAAASSGYVLSIKNRGDNILVQVASNAEDGLDGTLLIGHLRGNLIFNKTGTSTDKNNYAVKLLTEELLDGVAQFTLFAPNGEPLCERLVFIDNPKNEAKFTINSNAKNYGPREKVTLDVALQDVNGKTLSGDFSMGIVTQSNQIDEQSMDIKSWLLLDSDLGRTVQNPQYFFQDKSEKGKLLLDALMLTHGWRRFVWSDLLNDKVKPESKYAPEKGIMITGKTTAFKNPYDPKRTMTTLNLFDQEILHANKSTNLQGEFSYGPFYFRDTLDVMVEAIDRTNTNKFKNKNFSILVEPPFPEVQPQNLKSSTIGQNTLELAQDYLKESYQEKLNDFKYDPNVTQLDEVTVVDRKINKRAARNNMITKAMGAQVTSGLFSRRRYTDSIPGGNTMSVLDLLGRVPGLMVFGNSVMARGVGSINASNLPLFLIDLVPTEIDNIVVMRANEIMFVDYVFGPDTSLWGSRGANGVIALYTNKGIDFGNNISKEYPGVANFKIPGFYKQREFYAPDYATEKDNPEKPDYRTTLFWEPSLKIGNDGKAEVDFYTGDSTGSYWVKIEGITDDGRPINGMYDIRVESSN